MDGESTFGSREHQIPDADVRECASYHHVVISTSRAISVEVLYRNPVRQQVLTGRRIRLDRAGRAYVVGSRSIAEDRKHTGPSNIPYQIGVGVIEIGRLLDVI